MPTFHAAPPRKRLKPLPPDLRPRRYTFTFDLGDFELSPDAKSEIARLCNHFQICPQIDRPEQWVAVLRSQAFRDIAAKTATDLQVEINDRMGGYEKTLTVTFTSRPKIGQKLSALLKLP
ncbi:MAG: hypothetical protein J0L73_28500 [Verrucomicrobia bacterium]|nr:hypothetical protein [Verrucomicrobiota bacterium]